MIAISLITYAPRKSVLIDIVGLTNLRLLSSVRKINLLVNAEYLVNVKSKFTCSVSSDLKRLLLESTKKYSSSDGINTSEP